MTEVFDESQEADVPEQAVKALKAAQLKAQASGRPQVLVIDGKLVRIVNGQETVLKVIERRTKVTRPSGREAS